MKDLKCKIEDKDFEPGSTVCDKKLCYTCEDGDWEKKGILDLSGDATLQL